MMTNVYAIFDKVAKEVSLSLMMSKDDELIIRTLKTCKLTEIIEGNLADFELYQVGTLDTERPSLCSLEIPKFVCNLEAIRK